MRMFTLALLVLAFSRAMGAEVVILPAGYDPDVFAASPELQQDIVEDADGRIQMHAYLSTSSGVYELVGGVYWELEGPLGPDDGQITQDGLFTPPGQTADGAASALIKVISSSNGAVLGTHRFIPRIATPPDKYLHLDGLDYEWPPQDAGASSVIETDRDNVQSQEDLPPPAPASDIQQAAEGFLQDASDRGLISAAGGPEILWH